MDGIEDLEQLFTSRAQIRIVNYFLDRPNESFVSSKISSDTRLGVSTVWRILRNLVKIGLVVRTKVGKQLCLYILVDSENTDLLIEFLKMIRPFLKKIQKGLGTHGEEI